MNLGIHMKNNNNFFFDIKLSVTMLFAALFFVTSVATADSHNIELKPGHPKQYTVKKGDTLWDIAGRFLNRPWYWPEIWHINEQIENPHLIYPGDVLQLVYINGRPYITRGKYGKRTVRLSPEVRIEELSQPIPTIPLDIINPFLTKNRVVSPSEYGSSAYIVGLNEGHLSAATDDIIYVRGISNDTNDYNYGIYRKGKIYRNPANVNDILGYEAIYLGEGTLEKKGDPATIYIENSKSEILTGHRLIPLSKDQTVDANFLPKTSTAIRPGSIVGVLTNAIQPGVTAVGAMDVVIIDMGINDGIETGDVFNIYKKGETVKDPYMKNTQVKLPDEINGTLMVFRPFKRMSYALVMDAQSSLRIGDVIKSPLMQ
jgi:hypothetical protein